MIIVFKPLSGEEISRLRMNSDFSSILWSDAVRPIMRCTPANCPFSDENSKKEDREAPSPLSPPTNLLNPKSHPWIFWNILNSFTTKMAESLNKNVWQNLPHPLLEQSVVGGRGVGGRRKSIPRSQSPKSGGDQTTSSVCFLQLHWIASHCTALQASRKNRVQYLLVQLGVFCCSAFQCFALACLTMEVAFLGT